MNRGIQNWQACSTAFFLSLFFFAQMAYIKALKKLLSKLRALENEYCSWDISSTPDCTINALTVCNHWLASMEKLPHKVVELSMNSLVKDIRDL